MAVITTPAPTTCPQGNPCPLGYSSPAWCSECRKRPEPVVKEEPAPVLDDPQSEPSKARRVLRKGKPLMTKGPPLPGVLDVDTLPTSAPTTPSPTATASGLLTHMVRHSMGARFDGHCKLCGNEIKAGDMISGVQPSFYEPSPLRWMCVDCGRAYDQAYDELANVEGDRHGQTAVVNASKVMLTYEWDELEEKWKEQRTTKASQWRRP